MKFAVPLRSVICEEVKSGLNINGLTWHGEHDLVELSTKNGLSEESMQQSRNQSRSQCISNKESRGLDDKGHKECESEQPAVDNVIGDRHVVAQAVLT